MWAIKYGYKEVKGEELLVEHDVSERLGAGSDWGN